MSAYLTVGTAPSTMSKQCEIKELVLNDQHDRSPAPDVEQQWPEHPREPSMNEVAARISDQLLVAEEAQRAHIRRIVWDFGRTQALALCAEVVEQADQDDQARVDRYFALVEENGIKKERPWLRRRERERYEVPKPVLEAE